MDNNAVADPLWQDCTHLQSSKGIETILPPDAVFYARTFGVHVSVALGTTRKGYVFNIAVFNHENTDKPVYHAGTRQITRVPNITIPFERRKAMFIGLNDIKYRDMWRDLKSSCGRRGDSAKQAVITEIADAVLADSFFRLR